MASAFNAFLAAMWIERNIRGATLHRKQKQKQMKKNKMLSDAKKVLYLVLMFACSGPAYAGIVKGIASKIVEAGFCGMTFWTVPLFAICLCGGRMPLRPYIFTIDSLGIRLLSVSFRVCFSPLTVGAYRIRPDVSEWEMILASKSSLKPCRAARQGFHARKSVAAKRSKVSMLVKVLPQNAARFPCS